MGLWIPNFSCLECSLPSYLHSFSGPPHSFPPSADHHLPFPVLCAFPLPIPTFFLSPQDPSLLSSSFHPRPSPILPHSVTVALGLLQIVHDLLGMHSLQILKTTGLWKPLLIRRQLAATISSLNVTSQWPAISRCECTSLGI